MTAVITNDTYSAASGVTIHGGRSGLPSWLSGQPVGKVVAVPGSIHAGLYPGESPTNQYGISQTRLAYSGGALFGSKFIIPASGGHGNSSDNSVTAIDLNVDSPAWGILCAATPDASRASNVAYYSDGKPSSRHLYWTAHFNPQKNRVMLYGANYVYGSAVQFPTVDGFNLANNTWDVAGTHPSGPGSSLEANCIDEYGNAWGMSQYNLFKIDVTTGSVTNTLTFGSTVHAKPMCWDSNRKQLFALCYGDGEGGSSGINANVFSSSGTVRTQITLADGAAKTQFLADVPAYAGVDYDPVNDCFWFYAGSASAYSRLYRITPNATSNWTIDLYSFASGSLSLVAGTKCNRFRYVAALKSLMFMANATSEILMMRTST